MPYHNHIAITIWFMTIWLLRMVRKPAVCHAGGSSLVFMRVVSAPTSNEELRGEIHFGGNRYTLTLRNSTSDPVAKIRESLMDQDDQ